MQEYSPIHAEMIAVDPLPGFECDDRATNPLCRADTPWHGLDSHDISTFSPAGLGESAGHLQADFVPPLEHHSGVGCQRWSDRACSETQAVPGGMLCVRMSSGAEEAVTRHLMWRDLLRFVG